MKKAVAISLLCVLLAALSGCGEKATVPAVKESTESVLSGTTEAATEKETGALTEEDALLGFWSNQSGVSAEFYQDADGSYTFNVTTAGYELSPNIGPYSIENGILKLEGWFSQNESAYSFNGDTLTLEINGCSFTLTRQERE